MRDPDIAKASEAEEAADYEAWKELMKGNLDALGAYMRAGHPIRPDSYVAEFLLSALGGGAASEFDIRLVAKGRGVQPWAKRVQAMNRRVRIGWFIAARVEQGLRFDDVIADAAAEFGIGRKSAEAHLTYFRKCGDRCGWNDGGADPFAITDRELLDFLACWDNIFEDYPKG